MKFIETSYREFVDSVMYSDSRIAEIINHVNPDVIVQDNYVCYPSIAKSGKPSVLLFSANPLALFSNSELPPPYFGLPLNDSTEWEQCDKILKETLLKSWQNFNKWVIEKGAPSLPPFKFQYISKHLNVYVYPKSLVEDYARFANLGPEFIGLDHTITTTPQKFEIPASLKALPGKLILFSLGSMASSDIELTKRLVAIMSKSKHRFIVSKGQDSDKYELPSNMWGEPRIPQMDILPLVDLFITHGGNNSFVESLYCGKPMIILPIFMDQHDNAQRAVEMKIGIKLNPFTVEEHVLLEAIDKLVNDASVAERINKISELMRKSSSMDLVIERIERIAQTSQIPSI
ncbi:glycosyl transferase-like protein [Dinothrombium tinctorium]|uniref:Glycosyl transferase-like protein n=1 Tax=Dinothrombium tinctorium TaxID=1965070 RepID=A0A443R2R4_9ACAR|nr:glycosyl transferase-like protein [Dinothrombium tinctorium]RWS09547.1 glycosyl transferase-like protein [Dinothrombium tinctorium]